jgi:DNA-binding NarL/FixJ family response regulator
MPNMKIHVLLADGRKILREGLCLLLEKHPDIKVVGEAEEAAAAVRLATALTPDLVILNVTASTLGADRVIRAIRAASPSTRLLALGVRAEAPFIRQVLEAGASACLTRQCAAAELVTAIRAVMTHKVYLSPRIAEAVVSGYVLPAADGTAPGGRALSPRERQTLQRIADGQTTKQIAAALRLSAKTVETHRRRIMQKLALHSVAELTKYALREGLTSIEVSR